MTSLGVDFVTLSPELDYITCSDLRDRNQVLVLLKLYLLFQSSWSPFHPYKIKRHTKSDCQETTQSSHFSQTQINTPFDN